MLFKIAKLKADGLCNPIRWDVRDPPTPAIILADMLHKVQKSRYPTQVKPKRLLGTVSADAVRSHAGKRPREVGAVLQEDILRLSGVLGVGIPAPLHQVLGAALMYAMLDQRLHVIVLSTSIIP